MERRVGEGSAGVRNLQVSLRRYMGWKRSLKELGGRIKAKIKNRTVLFFDFTF